VAAHAFTQEKAPDRTLAPAGPVVSIVTVLGFPAIGSGVPLAPCKVMLTVARKRHGGVTNKPETVIRITPPAAGC
jgi:hypothetical protein